MITSNSKNIVKNTAYLYMRMLFVMLINFFSVRYVLKGLGVVDYGVFNVVAGLATMFQSFSSIISSATLRFHSYAIGEGKEEKVSDVFTASFNIFGVLSLAVLLLGEVIGVWFINTQADIPVDRMVAANWVFQFTMVTFVMSLMTAPFSSLIFAYERMSVFSVVSVTECFLKFMLAYLLVYITSDHLVVYGAGLLIVQILVWATYFISSKSGGGQYHYKSGVDKSLYKKMLSFSGWTLFSTSAGVGISQLVTMITNVFFGPIVNAARAIAFQVNTAMSLFSSSVIMATKPHMIKLYAEGDYKRVNRYFGFSNKILYYSLLLVLLPLFFEMEEILYIWLDINDSQTILFCRLMLIYSLILSINNPISIIVQATGNIRAYSTYVEIPTLLCFPMTWVLFAVGMPAETAFYVMIVAIIISHIIRLICLKRLFPVFSYRDYTLSFVLPAIFITIVVCALLYLVRNFFDGGFLRLLVSFTLCTICIVLMVYFGGLKKSEREALLSLLKIKSSNKYF